MCHSVAKFDNHPLKRGPKDAQKGATGFNYHRDILRKIYNCTKPCRSQLINKLFKTLRFISVSY